MYSCSKAGNIQGYTGDIKVPSQVVLRVRVEWGILGILAATGDWLLNHQHRIKPTSTNHNYHLVNEQFAIAMAILIVDLNTNKWGKRETCCAAIPRMDLHGWTIKGKPSLRRSIDGLDFVQQIMRSWQNRWPWWPWSSPKRQDVNSIWPTPWQHHDATYATPMGDQDVYRYGSKLWCLRLRTQHRSAG